jgi:hypothetical protein
MAADVAALALLHLDGSAAPETDAAGYPSYHLQVHQATGMVQVQMGVSPEEALLLLRARAFALGLALEDIAMAVVTRQLRFTTEDR